MDKSIAVVLDGNGMTTSLEESSIVKVYFMDKGNWKVIKEIICKIDDSMSLILIRENIKIMIEALGNCRIFIGNKVTGLPYTIFEKMGYNIWEIVGRPEEFLDYVLEKECDMDDLKLMDEVKPKILAPVNSGKEGYFTIDLKKIQEGNMNVSSKQVLLPFLNNTTFYELKIICSHQPNWLATEFKRRNLKAEVQSNTGNMVEITVSHIICSE